MIPKELEGTLIICSTEPDKILSQIYSIQVIDSLKLISQKPVKIQDYYFDTLDNQLRDKRFTLRVRDKGNLLFLTLKGKAQLTDWGGIDRTELEIPWSESSLQKIVEVLRKQGVDLILPTNKTTPDSPVKYLIALNMKIIQKRETNRRIKIIKSTGQKDRRVEIEIAYDHVNFYFKEKNIHHSEIEIEQKSKNFSDITRKVYFNLQKKFSAVLSRWNYSKLETGLAVESLLKQNQLDQHINKSNDLMPQAYPIIKDFLENIAHP